MIKALSLLLVLFSISCVAPDTKVHISAGIGVGTVHSCTACHSNRVVIYGYNSQRPHYYSHRTLPKYRVYR